MTAAGLQQIIDHIEVVDLRDDLTGCDLLIEAVFEDMKLKMDFIARLDALVAPDGFVASNTSALSISALSGAMGDLQRFLGLHFFSPVDRMDLVEIVVGEKTAPAILARAYDYTLAIAKTPIVVRNSRGFFASRVFQKFIYKAAAMVGEGVPAVLIENAALQAGYPAGPLSLLDDTSLALSVRVIGGARQAAAKGDAEPENHPGEKIIHAMVEKENRRGRSAGRGFCDYSEAGKRLWAGFSGLADRQIGPVPKMSSISKRFLYAQTADVLRCATEGVIRSAAEINNGTIKAIGFPKWTGGPLRLISETGPETFFACAQRLASQHGRRFALPVTSPAALAALLYNLNIHDIQNREHSR